MIPRSGQKKGEIWNIFIPFEVQKLLFSFLQNPQLGSRLNYVTVNRFTVCIYSFKLTAAPKDIDSVSFIAEGKSCLHV